MRSNTGPHRFMSSTLIIEPTTYSALCTVYLETIQSILNLLLTPLSIQSTSLFTTMASAQSQQSTDSEISPQAGPYLECSRVDVESESIEAQDEQYKELDFCAIPIHILTTAQKYFLETAPEPGKIISINLVSVDEPVKINLSDLQFLEVLAIPEHVLLPLQEYFLNRRANPKDYPKYVGVRITQEDARLYDNVLSCCSRGCAHELSKEVESEMEAKEAFRESHLEDPDGTTEHESSEEHQREAPANTESVCSTHRRGSDNVDVDREEDGSSEENSEDGVWIIGLGASG